MSVPKDRYWAKVLFKEFIRHYRKLSDDEIVEDVKTSMDDLDDLNDQGTSFGSKMVRWSFERANTPSAEASRANGSKGGRPRNGNGSGDGTGATPGHTVNTTTQSATASNRSPPSRRGGGFPTDKAVVTEWALDNGLDPDDAGECWEATTERGGRDADGNPVRDWKGFVFRWCGTRRENRER